MSVYLYAILFIPETTLKMSRGIQQQVEQICSDRLATIVESGISLEELQQTDEKLLEAVIIHDRVIREIFKQTDLLPLRFGNIFRDRESLLTHLKKYQEKYISQLNSLADRAEYTLTLTPRAYEGDPRDLEVKGKAYLLAKKKRYQQQQEFQNRQQKQWQEIHQLITEKYPDSILNVSKSDVKTINLLAQRNEDFIIKIENQIIELEKNCNCWEIKVSEALPPYHFV